LILAEVVVRLMPVLVVAMTRSGVCKIFLAGFLE
jgi:hypothetical protein